MDKEKLELIEEVLEELDYSVNILGDFIEFETWTSEGVNMIHSYDIKDFVSEFREYVRDFSPESAVVEYAEDSSYMRDIGIKAGLRDFEEYKIRLERTVNVLTGELNKGELPPMTSILKGTLVQNDIILLRNGDIAIYNRFVTSSLNPKNSFLNLATKEIITLDWYNENLLSESSSEYDVVAIGKGTLEDVWPRFERFVSLNENYTYKDVYKELGEIRTFNWTTGVGVYSLDDINSGDIVIVSGKTYRVNKKYDTVFTATVIEPGDHNYNEERNVSFTPRSVDLLCREVKKD